MKYGADIGQNWKLIWAGTAGFLAIALLLFFLSYFVVDPAQDSRLIQSPAEPKQHAFEQAEQYDEPASSEDSGASVGTTNMRIRVGQHYVYVYST